MKKTFTAILAAGFLIAMSGGVPADMTYLACAESTLNPRAYSPAKTAGIWQFLASIGKQYGLEVNDEIDERYNIEKATATACRYLKEGLKKYGDWPTVMAAYNAGMRRISCELDKQIAGKQERQDIQGQNTGKRIRLPFKTAGQRL